MCKVLMFVLLSSMAPFFVCALNLDSFESFRDSTVRYCQQQSHVDLKVQCVKDFSRRFEILKKEQDTVRGRELVEGCNKSAATSASPYQALLICVEYQQRTQSKTPFPELSNLIHESGSLRNSWLHQCSGLSPQCFESKRISFSEFWDNLVSLNGEERSSSRSRRFMLCLPSYGNKVSWDFQKINNCLKS
jgi:hypothetical protein